MGVLGKVFTRHNKKKDKRGRKKTVKVEPSKGENVQRGKKLVKTIRGKMSMA